MMDRLGQLALSLPRAAVALVVIGVAPAVLALLGPTIFLRDREPFNRLMEFLELVLGRPCHPSAVSRLRPPGKALDEIGGR